MNLKQTSFATYYADGETKGNATKSAQLAGYSKKTAYSQGQRLLKHAEVKKAITDALKRLDMLWKDGVAYVITRLRTEMEATTSVSALCLLVNAQKGFVDMRAKNEGQYAADNAQRTEEAKLSAVQVKEAKEYAKWRLLKGLEEQELGAEILQEAQERR